jgi:Fe-S-cluster containining protein
MGKHKNKQKVKKETNNKKDLARKMKMSSLKGSLDKIYSMTDMETTMACQCTCCKTAMPSHNYSEFVQIITDIWQKESKEFKIHIICQSIEYFFRNEFEKWGIESLLKPCMLLDQESGKCTVYENRPISCRLFGLWPNKSYEERVDKFEKAYEKYGLKREDLPLFKQCELVKRVKTDAEIDQEIIDKMFESLDNLDKKIGNFSQLQIEQKENYRTFHDWLLLKVFGEEWLSMLTSFMLAADKKTMLEQIEILKEKVHESFSKNMIKLEDHL